MIYKRYLLGSILQSRGNRDALLVAAVAAKSAVLHGHSVGEQDDHGNPNPDHILFDKIMWNICACVEKESGWQDEAMHGGLVAMRDIPRLKSQRPQETPRRKDENTGFLRTFSPFVAEVC